MRNTVLSILTILFLSLSWATSAQEMRGGHNEREAFHAKRNAYIIAELKLTPEEAAAFIPLMREYLSASYKLSAPLRKRVHELRGQKDVPDATYEELIDAMVEHKIKDAELEKTYYQKFKEVLPPKKLLKYKGADMKFGRSFIGDRNRKRGKM